MKTPNATLRFAALALVFVSVARFTTAGGQKCDNTPTWKVPVAATDFCGCSAAEVAQMARAFLIAECKSEATHIKCEPPLDCGNPDDKACSTNVAAVVAEGPTQLTSAPIPADCPPVPRP